MITGGIIAAGHGSRLKKEGFSCPKPLVRINGEELLGRTVNQFKKAGINSIRIIFRKSICAECSNYLAKKFPEMEFDIICRDTKSSAESFLCLLEEIQPEEKLLITTVDSIFQDGAFRAFVEKAAKTWENEVVLGITRFVDDEKPLFVTLKEGAEGHIMKIGGQSGDAVTCGVYLVPARVRKIGEKEQFPALRRFLGRLFDSGIPFRGIDMGKVIDVDRLQDVKEAERFLSNLHR